MPSRSGATAAATVTPSGAIGERRQRGDTMVAARRTGLIGAAIGALLLGVIGAVAPAAADDARPPIDVALTPAGVSLVATWNAFGYVPSETRQIHVTLPPELLDYSLTGYSWRLSGLESDLTGVLPATQTSFDIDLPLDLDHASLQLDVVAATGGDGDSAMLSALIWPSVPGVGDPPIVVVDADLDPTSSKATGTREHVFTGEPAALTLQGGDRIALKGAPGLWTTGPTGDWGDAFVHHQVEVSGSNGELPLEASASSDGSTLLAAMPDDVSRLRADTLLVAFRPLVNGEKVVESIRFDSRVSIERTISATRVDGADRYAVAAAASAAQFPEGAPVAYVVTGEGFADALSAGPAAAKDGGPLLLTHRDELTADTAAELQRLSPGRIVVVGGEKAVSDGVLDTLAGIAPVQRFAGADRFAVSRAVLDTVFGPETSGLYLATGAAFPDALAAGAAAGAAREPVLVVDGRASALDDATGAALSALPLDRVAIVGGPAAVSEGLADDVAAIAPVQRYGGADRFEVAAALNAAVFDFAPEAFVATGADFPDALAGSAWAGRTRAPLYVTRPGCLPAEALAAMRGQDVSSITVLGGPLAVADPVLALETCTG
ncbi:cell wall-binding repeat-containing protein [Herbiconiux sp. CPCC 205716]|uniref:Cell wall-binding repeat-containing protein n=1 Tax=Herbiconiux gentiana TaxID=2970912 RepID=A0ABT2GIW4_9MICO|nr:cell wall-binding repeat-containing protein [Herbiconiux gentiana]MCS5716173.1 cell wall-binding repeat-containing protein [Herbiconiux gentiana]